MNDNQRTLLIAFAIVVLVLAVLWYLVGPTVSDIYSHYL